MKQLDLQNSRFATVKASTHPTATVHCRVAELHGKRMALYSEAPFAVSCPVSIELDDALYLGEVITCQHTSDGHRLEIKIEQVLSGLQSLMSLRAALLNESPVRPSTSVGQLQFSRA